jgi:hypothetical protein
MLNSIDKKTKGILAFSLAHFLCSMENKYEKAKIIFILFYFLLFI